MELSCPKKLNTLSKTSLGETGCLGNLYYLLAAQASNFLIHSAFPNTVSWTTLDSLHLAVRPFCGLRDAMLLLPREAEYFPRGGKYFNHVPLVT